MTRNISKILSILFLFNFFVPAFSTVELKYTKDEKVDLYGNRQEWVVTQIELFTKSRKSSETKRLEYTFKRPIFCGLLNKEAKWIQRPKQNSDIKESREIRAIKKTEKTRPTLQGYLTGGLTLAAIGCATWWKWFKN